MPGQAKPGQVGPGHAESYQARPGQVGPAQASICRFYRTRPGRVGPGQARSSCLSPGKTIDDTSMASTTIPTLVDAIAIAIATATTYYYHTTTTLIDSLIA